MLQNKILMIDDEKDICDGLQRILTNGGYIADIALSGKEGIQKANDNNYDVVITDLKMPDINGMDVMKKIKKQQPDTQFIMITGFATVSTAVEAMKLGAVDCISKPFEPGEIRQAVKNAIRNIDEALKAKGLKKGRFRSIIEKKQVQVVLNRLSNDSGFWTELVENGSDALKEYKLSPEAKAAIISGDIKWLEKKVGSLTDEQLRLFNHILGMERW